MIISRVFLAELTPEQKSYHNKSSKFQTTILSPPILRLFYKSHLRNAGICFFLNIKNNDKKQDNSTLFFVCTEILNTGLPWVGSRFYHYCVITMKGFGSLFICNWILIFDIFVGRSRAICRGIIRAKLNRFACIYAIFHVKRPSVSHITYMKETVGERSE